MYTIWHSVPYEGSSDIFHGTREELKEWFRTRDTYSYNLNDLEITMSSDVDVWELAEEVENEQVP